MANSYSLRLQLYAHVNSIDIFLIGFNYTFNLNGLLSAVLILFHYEPCSIKHGMMYFTMASYPVFFAYLCQPIQIHTFTYTPYFNRHHRKFEY